MGNCSGFCMSTNQEGQDQTKKVSADKVRSALYEKDEMFREGVNYEDAYQNQYRGGGNNQIQARKLQKSNNQYEASYNGGATNYPEGGDGNNGQASERESLGPITLANGAIYTG